MERAISEALRNAIDVGLYQILARITSRVSSFNVEPLRMTSQAYNNSCCTRGAHDQ